ncbi:MAG: intradiol ring-cleavage dioxygenase [Vicinamibacterales bacterium]|nr:intradiol ring-cleavage dioxygenase [Vicinamibacterales bacterium]
MATSSTNALCTVTPALTEGPYFVDEGLNRSDIRSDPSTGVAKAGVPLTMRMQLSQVSTLVGCTPLVGALVDMWHCDALGVYSDIAAQSSRGQRFLRGYQISDANGEVRFTTVYPGWYQGRAVHIHFKVRTNPGSSSGLEFTSQLFFDEALTDIVHAQSPYATKGRRDTLTTRDGIYSGGGSQLLLPLAASEGGYDGTMYVGVRV